MNRGPHRPFERLNSVKYLFFTNNIYFDTYSIISYSVS
jgi:hypothetical protein